MTHANAVKPIIGTYCTDEQWPTDYQYLMFQQDGTYSYYIPDGIIGEGAYSAKDEMLYALLNGESKMYAAYDGKDKAVLLTLDGLGNEVICVYARVSDLPMLYHTE